MLWNPKWFPGTNLQDINLDWILKKVSALRGGRTGQYLCKKSDKDFDFGWKTGGGGGGGTSDYLDLDNKPSINNVELAGNKTAADLGLAASSDIPEVPVQSVNGKTGVVVLSASDVGAYVKPESGIPKTDLSSDVQTSLDKADTAYTKPESGIPKTDLSSAVKASLDKADSALQAVPSEYRTAEAQDTIDAAQNTQIEARAKTDEIAIVITGARPALAVTAGQYVIVRNSTINGITDGLYTANTALSPITDVTAANLTAVSVGGFNELKSKLDALGNPYFRKFRKPNITCDGNSTVIVDMPIGDVPSGWAATAVTSWIDATDTTSAANYGQTFLLNEWGHAMQTGTGITIHLMYSNLNSNQAKFTANLLVMYTRV